jgi:hypothetical protein
LPNVVSDKLMELVSAMFCPSTLDRLTLSDPAKSTKYNLDKSRVFLPSFSDILHVPIDIFLYFSQIMSKTEWLLLDWSFILVALVILF